MRTTFEIEQLVQHLQKSDWSYCKSDFALHSDSEVESALIISKWLESLGVLQGVSCEDRIYHIMEKLESFATTCPGLALMLMNALQPVADELYMHDVYDAIELWGDAYQKRQLPQ